MAVTREVLMKGRLLFLFKVFAGLIFLLGLTGLAHFIQSHFESGWGVFWGVTAAISLGFGGLLLFWLAVDISNLHYIKRDLIQTISQGGFRNNKIHAIAGTVRAKTKALTSPISQQPCVAYHYRISYNRHKSSSKTSSSRVLVAQGFHLTESHIAGMGYDINIGAIPEVESELRNTGLGEWSEQVGQFLQEIIGKAPASDQMAREAQLLEARLLEARLYVKQSMAQDYCLTKVYNPDVDYSVTEHLVPVDEEVCMIGTYNKNDHAMTGQRPRFGPNLMVYRGSVEHVISCIGNDVKKFSKALLILLAIPAAILAYITIT